MFKCTIWLDAACLSSTLCESEAISQSLRAISAHRSSDMITSPTNQRGKLKAVSHRKHVNAASVITHQLSLKGKAAADVAEVAKHLNITHDVRDAEMHIMEFTV